MVEMADSLSPETVDCFLCPQGDKPCPATYQPGAWLAQLPTDSVPAVQDRPQRSGDIEASIQQALRRLYEAMAGDPRRPGQPAG